MQQGNAFQSYHQNGYNFKPSQQQTGQQNATQETLSQDSKVATQGSTTSTCTDPTNMGEWPPELKDYVTRAFASATIDTEKDQVEHLLKEKITYTFKNGMANKINWAKEPLPHQSQLENKTTPPKPSKIQQSMLQHSMQGSVQKARATRWDGGPASANRQRQQPPVYHSRQRSPLGFRRRSRSSSSSRSHSRSRSRSRSRTPPSHYRKDRRRRHFSNSASDSFSDDSSETNDRTYGNSRGNRGRGNIRGRNRDSSRLRQQNTPKKDQENFNNLKKGKKRTKQQGYVS